MSVKKHGRPRSRGGSEDRRKLFRPVSGVLCPFCQESDEVMEQVQALVLEEELQLQVLSSERRTSEHLSSAVMFCSDPQVAPVVDRVQKQTRTGSQVSCPSTLASRVQTTFSSLYGDV